MLKKPTLKKTIISSLLLVLLSASCVFGDTGTIINEGSQSYKAIRVTPEIYNKANANLYDILIKDETGNPVPHFINSLETTKTEDLEKTYPLRFMNDFIKDGDYYADYFIESNENIDILSTQISVSTQNSTFAKNIEIRGSYDGTIWDFIQKDILYKVDENKKLTIEFHSPLKYTYYRLKILDNAEHITFDTVWLTYSQITVDQFLFKETIVPSFEATQQEKSTVVQVYGLKNMKVDEIRIDTDSQFKRSISYESGKTKTLYHLTFQNSIYQDTVIPYNGYRSTSDVLKFTIQNGDDTPITIDKITVSYYADEIIFKGEENAVYTVSFGDESITAAPEYDIKNYKELILSEGYDVLTIEKITQADAPEETPPVKDYTATFNIIVVAVSLLLGFVILVNLKRTSAR